jgi:hypothetical protein
MDKSSQIVCATSVTFKKQPDVNNRPKGEKSPNLVTLLWNWLFHFHLFYLSSFEFRSLVLQPFLSISFGWNSPNEFQPFLSISFGWNSPNEFQPFLSISFGWNPPDEFQPFLSISFGWNPPNEFFI